jgi:gliding motility-associated-like protein
MKLKSTKCLLLALLCLAGSATIAQEYGVGSEIPANCQSFLTDSGMSAGNYQPNEDLTSTICQDGSGENLVNLYFVYTELSEGDVITIYDGSDDTAPSFGTFAGTELQGVDITSTNAAGCLTVNFTSNDDDLVGSFLAEITCTTPCARPVAIITTDETQENPIKVCVGEEITFNGSSSTFAEGMSLGSFTWDFLDGQTNTTDWPSVTHSFSQPGAYVVQLSLTDNNGCTSGNLPDKLVYVSTTPVINVTSDDYNVCVGQEFTVDGNVTPVLWTALPTANFGGALFIPDDQTICFGDTLLFGGFSPGSTVASENDIANLFINFEHSYMGDITITFICPNGQLINVHQQGGGGTFLGEPIDNDADLTPGIGYDYFWSPTATNGTWIDNTGGTLPSGTYESVQSFTGLVGCPLNGEWIVEICDAFGSDNGFIFDWSVTFAEYLYPELISFTPSIGAGADSSFLSGPFFIDLSAGGDTVLCVPTTAGNHIYTYTAIDDFGCTYTEDISVTAYDGPIVTTSGDLNFCGPEENISGSVTNPVQGMNYVYSWTPSGPVANPTASSTIIESNGISESTEFVFSVYPTDDTDCIIKDTIFAFIPAVPLNAPIDTAGFCSGYTYDFYAPSPTNGYTYDWYYSSDGIEYTEQASGGGYGYGATQAGYYYVEVFEPVCNFSSITEYFAFLRPCKITVPNVFTPNGNAGNNYFEIFGLEDFPNSTLQVYNRWGNLVYENKNYQNNWDADGFAEGTYYYILGVSELEGMKYRDGHVTILRE